MTFWIPPAAVGGRFRSCLLTRPGLESARVERERGRGLFSVAGQLWKNPPAAVGEIRRSVHQTPV